MDQTDLHQKTVTFDQTDPYEKVRRLYDFEHGLKLKILDVGSGNGLLGRRLRSHGHEVIGLDVNPSAGDAWIKLADISKPWPVESGSFDIVICTDVAEHLCDPVYVLKESRRVLKPGGRLIFGVPNHFDLRQRLRMLFGKGIVHWDNLRHGQHAWDYVHVRFFSLNDVCRLFAAEGWSIEKVQYNFMGGGVIPASLTPALIRKLLVGRWPGLFSGKFIFCLVPDGMQNGQKPQKIILPITPPGL